MSPGDGSSPVRRSDLRRVLARWSLRAGPLRTGPLVTSVRRSQWLSRDELGELQAADLGRAQRRDGGKATFGRRVSSSGTGGASTSSRWSVEAMRWQDAVEERSREWAGVGDGRSRVWVCCNRADRLRRLGAFVSNTRLLAAGDVARDESRLGDIADLIAHRPPAVVQGVSNVLAALGRELERRGAALPDTVCLSAGNHLTPWYRRSMEAVFAQPVRERYAVSEVGLIAATCELGTLHVNAETLLLEVLDPRGAPLPPGGVGELAVTMLHNRGADAVRRRVGDVGVLTNAACGCGRGLPTLELWGRVTKLIPLVDGRVVPPRALFEALDEPAILETTFRYSSGVLEVSMRCDPSSPGPDVDRIETRLAPVVGEDVRVVTRNVSRFEPSSSGKLPIVVVSAQAAS